ncbi:MAG: Alpha-glucosidase [Alphaproteobacteria bacterium MarineAlpha5_Bin12]|nr:glycosyl hydrolase family 4 [Pelagibacteraceae bacterium]PPR41104.1 MAG: Alpha-glucosidase [Alphaproteobacteria bacterium MarineAlpha5_Bin12]|tara:strand:- start:25960 stop:27273 length:1314 start_codon:yes stop_codon:yes gene_type:complete
MNKIVLIGAGSTNFGLGTIGDIFKSKILKGSTIMLHDINSNTLERAKNIAEKYKDELKLNFKIEATTNRKEALKNANYCIISIEVHPRFDLWDQDWKVPLQYGFRQVFGENGGPGGLFHSLRVTPPIIEICDDINIICPDAFVFNYSNPMQRVCQTVTTKYPKMKFVGLCHEIASMERHLPDIMETPFDNIEFKAGGLNHFSILVEAKYKDTGKDAYPIIRKKIPDYYKNYTNDHEVQSQKPGGERGVFFELFNRYNYLPITTDSHLGEYIQWAYSVADHEAIMDFYNKYRKHCLTFYETENSFKDYFDLNKKPKERIITIIEGIINNSNYEEAAVNIPNKDFIKYLPNGIVVEVPGIIGNHGVKGVKLDNYPADFASLLMNQSSVMRLTAEAILEKSKTKALKALLADPIVDNVKSAEKMLNNMIQLQYEHLSYLN